MAAWAGDVRGWCIHSVGACRSFSPPTDTSSNPNAASRTAPSASKLKISVGPSILRVTERGKVDFLHKRNPVFDERWGSGVGAGQLKMERRLPRLVKLRHGLT